MIAARSRAFLAGYNTRLRRRHPKVRVRWNYVRGAFILEERVAAARAIDPRLLSAERADVFVQHRDGYATIEYLRELPPVGRLADALEASRIAALLAHAGVTDAGALADKLDAEYAMREARERESFRDLVAVTADDEYDRAQWRTGDRVAVPAGAP